MPINLKAEETTMMVKRTSVRDMTPKATLILLLDISASMESSILTTVDSTTDMYAKKNVMVEAVESIIADLKKRVLSLRVIILTFDQYAGCIYDGPSILMPKTWWSKSVPKTLEGYTDIANALYTTLQYMDDVEHPRILMLSDGADAELAEKENDLLIALKAKTTILDVVFIKDAVPYSYEPELQGMKALERISIHSGGKFTDASTVTDVLKHMLASAKQLLLRA